MDFITNHRLRNGVFWIAPWLFAPILTGCNGAGSTPPMILPRVVVTVAPVSVNLAAGGSQQFTAKVDGTPSTAVTWKVNDVAGGSAAVGTISAAGLYTAPSSAVTVIVSAVAQVKPADSAPANVSVLAPHRFGVRPTSTLAEFFDRTTGNAFTPRGSNYIRLATLTDPNGNPFFRHSTFSVGLYDAARAETALAAMQASGYNIVTVILEGCCVGTIGDPAGGLSSAYIANVADFLHHSRAHGIAVVFASQWLPNYGGFQAVLLAADCYPQFNDINLVNLSSCGVNATKLFFQDFVQALIDQNAPMDAIFAYEIWDEYYYYVNASPLNSNSGTITAANGQTYDMSSPTSKQQMMDDGLVFFTDQIRAAILTLDPTALVTISFFPPQSPNPSRPGDLRFITIYPAITRSTVDYVDVHPYPIVLNLTMDQAVQNLGFIGYQQQKPVLMGEFGAFMFVYPTVSNAAAGLQSWQAQSCPYDFKGWVLWTWDTDEQPELWNGMSQGGVIQQSLSPASRPNPCSP